MTDNERQIDDLSRHLVWQHICRHGYLGIDSSQAELWSKEDPDGFRIEIGVHLNLNESTRSFFIRAQKTVWGKKYTSQIELLSASDVLCWVDEFECAVLNGLEQTARDCEVTE